MRIIPIFLLLISCTSVSWNLNKEEFKSQNLPIRELRVIVFKDDFILDESISALISESNGNLESQAGIKLRIIEVIKIKKGWAKSVFTLRDDMEDRLLGHENWDIALTVTHQTPHGFVMANSIGWILAYVDDLYRRYIVIREKSPWVLEHEIWHCFITSKNHSIGGIMGPLAIRILPLTPAIPLGRHLTKSQRNEVLRNKWRSFSESPYPRDEKAINEAIRKSKEYR